MPTSTISFIADPITQAEIDYRRERAFQQFSRRSHHSHHRSHRWMPAKPAGDRSAR